jgi:hypothetical protein
MDLELPKRLHATRDLLTRSLVMHSDQAPAIPAGLAADLAAHFATRGAVATGNAPVSWLEKIRSFLSAPAFGAVAAAVVVLGVAIPMLSGPAATPGEIFRGGTAPLPDDAAKILFVGENPDILSAVKASGNFEAAAISTVENALKSVVVPGPKVIIDFTAATITAVDREGSIRHSAPLPAKASEVADAIAFALTLL